MSRGTKSRKNRVLRKPKVAIGMARTSKTRVLLEVRFRTFIFVHTERHGRIRIISAREATRQERLAFQEKRGNGTG